MAIEKPATDKKNARLHHPKWEIAHKLYKACTLIRRLVKKPIQYTGGVQCLK